MLNLNAQVKLAYEINDNPFILILSDPHFVDRY